MFDKPEGMTSFRAVSVCKAICGVKKAGHAGTLDPLATGVLPILFGNATALSEFLSCDRKSYLATFKVGAETDTQDLTGTVMKTSPVRPDVCVWQEAAKTFLGKTKQIPPMYSALKKDGVPLYKLARRGESVTREPRDIEIYEITVSETKEPDVLELSVACSKGTYIRTLIEDLARKVDTCAAMRSLRRLEHGAFSVESAVTLEVLEAAKGDETKLNSLILPVERVLGVYPKLTLSAFSARLAKCGAEIYREREGYELPLKLGERVRLYDENGRFFALGEYRAFLSGEAVKPIRFFLES